MTYSTYQHYPTKEVFDETGGVWDNANMVNSFRFRNPDDRAYSIPEFMERAKSNEYVWMKDAPVYLLNTPYSDVSLFRIGVEWSLGGKLGEIPVTKDGYKKLDVKKDPVAFIPSNSITMRNLPYKNMVPIEGTGIPSGRKQIMYPGLDYLFDGDYGVIERPLTYQYGGLAKPFSYSRIPAVRY